MGWIGKRGAPGSTTIELNHSQSQGLKQKEHSQGPPLPYPSPLFQGVPGKFPRPLLDWEGFGRSVLVMMGLANKMSHLARTCTGSEAPRNFPPGA